MKKSQSKKKVKPKVLESRIQAEFFKIVNAIGAVNSKYTWITGYPTGINAAIHVHAQMTRQGAKDGVPDVLVPRAASGKHMLWLEFKCPKPNKTYQSKKQKLFERDALAANQGYVVVRSVSEALRVVQDYFADRL